jgi:hypothetical protein
MGMCDDTDAIGERRQSSEAEAEVACRRPAVLRPASAALVSGHARGAHAGDEETERRAGITSHKSRSEGLVQSGTPF